MFPKPFDDVLLTGGLVGGSVERCLRRVLRGPVEVGPRGEEPFGGTPLRCCASVPEGSGDLILARAGREEGLDTIQSAQGGGMPQLVNAHPVCGQQFGDVPAAVADRVVQRCSDRPAGCLGVGAPGEQGTRDIDIVAARRPVQRCLTVGLVSTTMVGVCAVLDQYPDNAGAVGEIAGPVRCDVQQSVLSR